MKLILTSVFCAMCLTFATTALANDNSSVHSTNIHHQMLRSACSK